MFSLRCLCWALFAGCLALAGCRTADAPVGTSSSVKAPPTAGRPPVELSAAAAAPIVAAPTVVAPAVAALVQARFDTLRTRRPEATTPPGWSAEAAARAFYRRAAAPAWVAADTLSSLAGEALALLAQAYAYGLQPADYSLPGLRALRDSLALPAPAAAHRRRLARFEVSLTEAVLLFAHDLQVGRRSRSPLPAATAAELRAALATGAFPAALLAGQPGNREYRQLQQALAQWLAQLPGPPDSAVARHRSRFERVALNLERWRTEPTAGPDYLLVNIPACELQVVARDSVQRRMRAIVGKPATPTPTLSSRIRYFTLAPAWNVPYSIASQEMLPRLQDDPGFLAESNLAVYDSRGRRRNPWRINWNEVTAQTFRYAIRQEAGPRNVLGNYVFHFPNPHLVYLHDTPDRHLFAQPDRALSHGCIRVERPRELAAWLLRREGNPQPLLTPAQARQCPPQDVLLRQPLPIYVRYATATAENGHLRFYPDIYGHDQALWEALYCR